MLNPHLPTTLTVSVTSGMFLLAAGLTVKKARGILRTTLENIVAYRDRAELPLEAISSIQATYAELSGMSQKLAECRCGSLYQWRSARGLMKDVVRFRESVEEERVRMLESRLFGMESEY